MKAAALLAFLVILTGCGGKEASMDSREDATDYSVSSHWLVTPVVIDKSVDIFYLYPTAWQSSDNSTPQVCEIDDATMQAGAYSAFERQATAFETVGNIYAPYYRQDNTCPTNREEVISGIPTMDGIDAFDYYLNHFNNGRPYILVGHSQGANVLSNLLSEYLSADPVAYQRMVAAYIIGYSVTEEYLAENPHLKFAQGPDDTGVIISYNTQAPDVEDNPVLYAGHGVVINPITWTTEETEASAWQSLGSFLPDAEGIFMQVPDYADARVDNSKGVLVCSSADEDALLPFTGGLRGVYHGFDIPFYYYNLRENAANRVARFFDE